MSRCRWTRSLCLLMLPALVLCGTAPSWGTISFSNNTLTYSSTSDLSSTIDPSGQKDVTNSYGITKASFQALNPQIVAFNGAPTASQTLRYLVANYDASNTVTFTFPSTMYNYGSMTTSGRGSFSGSATQDAISTVPVQNGSLYDWFDASISCTGSQGVQSLGFCVAFRSNQAVAAGEVLYTLSDASTETVTLPALGGSGNPEYVFIGYTAPSGKTITRVQAARTSAAGGGYVSIDDLSFVMSPDTTAPTVVSDLATSNPTASSITLSWTAPGDDGSTGTAASYDIRCSSSAINEGNWASATQVTGEPAPALAGTIQNMTVSGLSADTTYYFAIETADEVPNWSAISNVPNAKTSDTVAPAAVSNLAAGSPTSSSLTLTWTAPGDDGSTGRAAGYDIRYSTSAITEGNWASATQATGEPAPASAGASESMVVGYLSPSTIYYFAIKTSDEVPNVSALSTVASGTTTAGGGNLALNKPATASSVETPSFPASYAVDGNTGTRWSTEYSDPQWIYVDLQATYAVNRVKLTWEVAYGKDYQIQVSSDASNWTTVHTVANGDGGVDDLSFAAANGRYVRMYGTARGTIYGYSLWEFEVYASGGGGDTTAPAAVTNLATGSPTASSLTLTWTAPGDDGSTGTAVLYDVRYSTSAINAGNWDTATPIGDEPTPAVAGTVQNMVISGLSADTTYYFAMKTSDEVPNTSAISNSPSGTTAPPGSSTIIALKRHAGLLSGGDIDARFTSASAVTTTVRDSGAWGDQRSRWQNGGASFTVSGGYAFYKFDLGAVPELACATINLAQLRIYHTTGNGSAGMGGVGMVLTYDWLEGTVNQDYPGAAGGVSFAHPVGYNTAWEQNASGGTEPPLQSWGPSRDSFLSMSVDASPVIDPFSAPSGVAYNTFDVTSHVQDWARGSHPNYGWVQQVGSWDFHFSEAGSDYEPVLFIDYSRTGDVTAPAAVTNLAAGSATSSSLTVTWTAPGDDGPTGTATSYDLRYSIWPINAGNWGAATQITSEPTPASPGTNQSMVVTGLKANTTYYFALKTADEMTNTSALSNLPSAPTLPDVTAPAAVNNLGTSNATSDSMTLSWTAPGDDGTVGTATTYDIRYSTSTINEGNWASATQVTGEPVPAAAGTNQSMVVTGLAHNTTYYFAMKTSDEIPNASALSNVATGTTPPDVAAPAAVTNLAITKPKSSTVTLTWTAPGDDGSTGTASSYDIRYSTSAIHAGNWGSATPATGEPVPAVAGTSQKIVIRNLTPQTTYYFAMKATDEAGNVSGLSNVPGGQTTDTSLINRPVICREDFQYLGAFLLPYTACDTSTAFNSTGLAIRRVDGQLRLITGAHRGQSDPIYEVAFPGWGTQWGAWPQATPTNQWGTTVYGTPSMKEIAYPDPGDDSFIWTHGLLYDEAANRLYYSFAPVYNVAQGNEPSLGYAVLEPSGPVAHGPWNAPVELANTQKIRGGSLLIPQWFANAYLGGRTLGLGFGGYYSGWSACSKGQFLAAAYPPNPSTTQLDVVPLIDYPEDHWGTRDPDYWSLVTWCPNPVNGVGFWSGGDSINGGCVWIDLPDRHGLLYTSRMAHGEVWYINGLLGSDWQDNYWWMYDPSDLVPVAQGQQQPWEPQREFWKMQYFPPPHDVSESLGCAFDAQTRTLFVVSSGMYQVGVEYYPVVHGWHIN